MSSRYEGPDCQRCFNPTKQCGVCNGSGKIPLTFGVCTDCDGTGWVCETDGKNWKR